MGMFSSLFGSAGSDKADKLRQQAMDAFNSVKNPELTSLQVQLDKYVQAGSLTPQQAEAALLNSNAYNAIKTDPSLVGAQKQALQQLQDTSNQGGLTALDRSKIQDIQDTLNTTARGRNQAVMQNAQERGIGGSGLSLQNQLMQEQSAADQASRSGTDVAAQAQARALQALQGAGQLGGQMESQQYGEQANKAASQNAIDKFNSETTNATNLYNTQAGNQAQAANLANAQSVSNANTAGANANKQYNAQQNQQVFNDQLQKAQGQSGVLQNWANSAQNTQDKETGANMALTGGLINAGATGLAGAFGGPAAGAVTSGMFSPTSGTTNKTTQGIGASMGYAEGGEVKMDEEDFKNEHNRLLNVLKNPSDQKLESEYENQKEEMTGKGYCSGGMMADGGTVTPSPTPVPTPKPENKTKDRSFMERVGDLIAQNAEAANQIDKEDKKGPYDFKQGGKVPGKAEVKGDSPKNDKVKALLSPGEIVIPRSKVNDEDEFNKFMRNVKSRKMANGGEVKPDEAATPPEVAPVAPAAVVNPPAAPAPKEEKTAPTAKGGVSSPTHTSTETGGSSPGGASTGGVGSGIGGAGTGGAATGGASTGGAGTVNVTISGNSTTKTASGNKGSGAAKKDSKSAGGDGGNDKKSPITINISNVGGKTDAGNVASGDGPGASGAGGSGKGSGGGGGGAAPSEPKDLTSGSDEDEFNKFMSKGGMAKPMPVSPRLPKPSVPKVKPKEDQISAALKSLQQRNGGR